MDQATNNSSTPVQSHARSEHVDRQRMANRSVEAPVTAQPVVMDKAPVLPTTPVPTTLDPMTPSRHTSMDITSVPVPISASVPTANSTANIEAFVLPPSIISRGDVARVVRELDNVDDFFHQSSLRGVKDIPMPSLSRRLDQVTAVNNINLLKAEDRAGLKVFMGRVKQSAPVIHMSFPAEAGSSFLAKILDWFRHEIHPYTVLQVGLQPELVAGFALRTTNKSFDFSFRKKFERSKQILIESMAVDLTPEDLHQAEITSNNSQLIASNDISADANNVEEVHGAGKIDAAESVTPAVVTNAAAPMTSMNPAATTATTEQDSVNKQQGVA
ncbi:hypothetical protein KC867_01830 [Candidatus Saccharibacteria bacterium]|nr:hypothetical protein [Candidatus Saccharibacteria bacterium]